MTEELKEKIAGEITLSNDPGMTIRKWREEFGLSQHQLAEAMGVSHSVISDYESGRRRSPGSGIIKKLVDAFIRLDKEAGSPTISKYVPESVLDCVIAMGEFRSGIPMDRFIEEIGGENLNPDRLPARMVYGYTVVDSLKAILQLSSNDYMKIYGWSTERALIFTDVHFGRSPMIAIRAHPLSPAVVVYQKPEAVDKLAIKLSRLEGIPLVTTQLEVEGIVEKLEKYREGI
ncbi:MAG: helix-turn-helix domain-containing protein [Thermoplasmata archaeon]|nr:helix-turn-helix domain-containing protein [Thermoplasmata archaeon]